MIRLSHPFAIIFSGLIWVTVGVFLLSRGINFIVVGCQDPSSYLGRLGGGGDQAPLMLIAVALFIGFLKGRLVLAKTANKMLAKIYSLPSPLKLSQIYGWKFLALIALMMGLGISLKYLPIRVEIRGIVNVAVGSALINGAMFYFRALLAKKIAK